jgi:hypothetical protein
MDGAQDMGGVEGFGPVQPEPNEPVFHADWERRAFALTLAMGMPGGWNIDMSRFARENRPPQDYLDKSYYQIWLAGLERLMLERGLVSAEEIEAGRGRGRRRRAAQGRTDQARRQRARPVQGRRPGAGQNHQPSWAHAAAALCARACRNR